MNAAKPVNLISQLSLDLPNVPAIPIVLDQWLETLIRLNIRALELGPAIQGLSNTYTIQGYTNEAESFLFNPPNPASQLDSLQLMLALLTDPFSVLTGFDAAVSPANVSSSAAPATNPLTVLSLDDPHQFAMSWTNYDDIYCKALPDLNPWASTLTDAAVATKAFWPLLSQYALAYNLLVVQKITSAQVANSTFGFDELPASLTKLATKGQLFGVDLSLFTSLDSETVGNAERFTPASFTFLRQDPITKDLLPIGIWVAGKDGERKQIYWRDKATDDAWLYALQAVKTSLTVYGIWIGHVYQWHIVPAAMQMTMYNTFSEQHPIYKLLQPHSNYLMAFDNILMLLWSSISPPTSLTTPYQFLRLINQYAAHRTYLDDDPRSALARQGINQEDFTSSTAWDQYPVVGQFLQIWDDTEKYMQAFVLATYANDAAIAQDQELQTWISATGDPNGGNITGFPSVQTQTELIAMLTSLLYRLTIHGVSRLVPSANPALTFVANYPPCLQRSTIPAPNSQINTQELLTYLPQTGTIGGMVTFYFTFSFSTPYVPLLPKDLTTNLFFPGGLSDPRNQALVSFRKSIHKFIAVDYPYNPPQHGQWPLNIET